MWYNSAEDCMRYSLTSWVDSALAADWTLLLSLLLSHFFSLLRFVPGKYHCPVLYNVFTNNSHIVANKVTGNVFSYEVSELVLLLHWSSRWCFSDRNRCLKLRTWRKRWYWFWSWCDTVQMLSPHGLTRWCLTSHRISCVQKISLQTKNSVVLFIFTDEFHKVLFIQL